jgi:para-aminobenzoate synthetase component I
MLERARDISQPRTAVSCELPVTSDKLVRALLSLESGRRLSLLDSCTPHEVSDGFLIAGFDPFEIIEARGNEITITRRGEKSQRVIIGDLLEILDARLDEYQVPPVRTETLPVAGACIATFSYDLVHRLERLRLNSAPRLSAEPDVTLAFYDTLVVHNYTSGITRLITIGDPVRLSETSNALIEALSIVDEEKEAVRPPLRAVTSNLTRDEYLAAVRQIKEHIAAGDIYQANLTQQLTCAISPELMPEDVFLRLRRNHPAQFAAFIRREQDVVISASPERFLRVTGQAEARVVEAWPIKGTRARGDSIEEDVRLRRELLQSEKDRAENIMIVDLLRNDLGRVCRYGSVEVTELCALEEHPTLFHLVSKVRGVLRDDVSVGNLLRATFPCGSITGAPKIRAMEIIAAIETRPRGLSMGAIGYFSFTGMLDLNVAIRTMVMREGVARFNVGGGIVADSSPELEYEESLTKARALLRALGAATQIAVDN